ncbi:MAG: sugar phosphate nucleotidyltransferase, partial [Planctomycetota bacterium]
MSKAGRSARPKVGASLRRGSGGGRAALHAVILAGGAGERFWPRSRASHPKPLIRLLGGRSLLEATVARARRVAGERVWLVCGHEHAVATRRQARLPASRVLVEPRRRNTAMAVAFAATRIAARDPEAL